MTIKILVINLLYQILNLKVLYLAEIKGLFDLSSNALETAKLLYDNEI